MDVCAVRCVTISFAEAAILLASIENGVLLAKSRGEPALLTAATFNAYSETLNLNACAQSDWTRIFWFRFSGVTADRKRLGSGDEIGCMRRKIDCGCAVEAGDKQSFHPSPRVFGKRKTGFVQNQYWF